MTPENFCYWLRGFIEIQKPRTVDINQLKVIEDHLDLVFKKVTPVRLDMSWIANYKQEVDREIAQEGYRVEFPSDNASC